LDTLNQKTSPAIGVLELMYTILHEFLHGIFPELNEEEIIEKTERVWTSGMTELINQK
jgi:predicted metal-dependent peptidase